MFVLCCTVQIGNISFDAAHEIEIMSDWREMTDKATIKIAKRIFVKGADLINKPIGTLIKAGDPVVIKLGYDGNLKTEFVGYVARSPLPTAPLEIQCEDEMWKLKRLTVLTKTFASGTVKDLIKYIAPGYKSEVLDSTLGPNYLVKTGTAAGALIELERVFGLKSFFRMVNEQPVLIVGKPYGSDDLLTEKPEVYHLQKNVKENSLQYKTADDIRIRIKAISKIIDGKDHKVEVGDPDGDVRTLHYYGLTLAEITKKANAALKTFKVDGYQGEIAGFGLPNKIRHGMQVEIIDESYENRTDEVKYHVDAVQCRWGVNGYEIFATIGWKAGNQSFDREV